MSEQLDTEQANRLWEHRLHIDNELYSRMNFFLVFESVLIGIVGVLYSKTNPVVPMIRIIILLGFGITIIWGYIQVRHKYILDIINRRAREALPEYRETMDIIMSRKWPLSSRALVVYVVPLLVALVWIIFFFIV